MHLLIQFHHRQDVLDLGHVHEIITDLAVVTVRLGLLIHLITIATILTIGLIMIWTFTWLVTLQREVVLYLCKMFLFIFVLFFNLKMIPKCICKSTVPCGNNVLFSFRVINLMLMAQFYFNLYTTRVSINKYYKYYIIAMQIRMSLYKYHKLFVHLN